MNVVVFFRKLVLNVLRIEVQNRQQFYGEQLKVRPFLRDINSLLSFFKEKPMKQI